MGEYESHGVWVLLLCPFFLLLCALSLNSRMGFCHTVVVRIKSDNMCKAHSSAPNWGTIVAHWSLSSWSVLLLKSHQSVCPLLLTVPDPPSCNCKLIKVCLWLQEGQVTPGQLVEQTHEFHRYPPVSKTAWIAWLPPCVHGSPFVFMAPSLCASPPPC